LDQLQSFVGHDDAARLTPEELLAWKAALLEHGLRTKTIRGSKLAPLRAILQWGVDNRKLPSNPAARIQIDVRKKITESIRGFTEEEAARILHRAAEASDPLWRWIPLICAYSGARLSEVCQPRKQDVSSTKASCA
jgi:integrase